MLLYLAATLGLWWLISSTMRDLGLSWKTITLLAGLYGVSTAVLWLYVRP